MARREIKFEMRGEKGSDGISQEALERAKNMGAINRKLKVNSCYIFCSTGMMMKKYEISMVDDARWNWGDQQ